MITKAILVRLKCERVGIFWHKYSRHFKVISTDKSEVTNESQAHNTTLS